MLEKIRIPKVKGGLANKLKGGRPKFEILNANSSTFEIIPTKAMGYLYSNPKEGCACLFRDNGQEVKLVDS